MATRETTDALQKPDGRRELGERTRQRLLDATSELLAERGEDAIRLRDITEAARVNVAAVNYHFGSVKALYAAATKEAVETIINGATEELSQLGDDATLEEIVAAWIRPAIAARTGASCGQRLAFLRITARAGSDPPHELCDWIGAIRSSYLCELVSHLRHALPDVPEHELRFRTTCALAILNLLSTSSMQAELQDTSAMELERLLVPVLTGTLAAGASWPNPAPRLS
jgi:AcrR family transcriptional regulator